MCQISISKFKCRKKRDGKWNEFSIYFDLNKLIMHFGVILHSTRAIKNKSICKCWIGRLWVTHLKKMRITTLFQVQNKLALEARAHHMKAIGSRYFYIQWMNNWHIYSFRHRICNSTSLRTSRKKSHIHLKWVTRIEQHASDALC